MAPLYHEWHEHLSDAEKTEAGHPPAQLKRFQGGLVEGPVANLCAQVIEHRIDRPNGLDGCNQFFEGILLHRIQQMPTCRPARLAKVIDHRVETIDIAAPAKRGMVTLGRKFFTD
jgi:hypothetical protein